ncbi:unnamed protein product, partial [marine sediment metagenome]
AGSTDDLYEVTLSPTTGLLTSEIKVGDITSNTHAWTFNGDIAVSPDGVLYGHGKCNRHGYEFFSVDLDGNNFTVIKDSGYTNSLQLAFGDDGELYGHWATTSQDGDFWEVDTSTGALTWKSHNPGMWYTDLASGPRGEGKSGDLIAGQHIDVGDVIVSNDGTYLYVTYEITEPDWIITGTHLYVGKTNPETEPLTSAPGQFPYDDDDATSVTDTMVTYEIPLDDIDSYSMKLNK